jgi:hypothetical protein
MVIHVPAAIAMRRMEKRPVSAWELHPVTQVYVCTAAQPGATDSNEDWVQLDTLVEH